jgi:hypothetical protein
VRLLRFDPDAPANELATAHLRITVKDQDERKVGRAFSNAAVELALAGRRPDQLVRNRTSAVGADVPI